MSLKNIEQIPYQIDDVDYINYKISLDNMDTPRFLTGYSKVQIT